MGCLLGPLTTGREGGMSRRQSGLTLPTNRLSDTYRRDNRRRWGWSPSLQIDVQLTSLCPLCEVSLVRLDGSSRISRVPPSTTGSYPGRNKTVTSLLPKFKDSL